MSPTPVHQNVEDEGAYAWTSVRGKHTENEDAVLTFPDIWAVADGMGGHQGGRIASTIAASYFLTGAAEPEMPLSRLIQLADLVVVQAAELLDLDGMGTTVAAATVTTAPASADDTQGQPCLEVAWCGDSRAYHWVHEHLTRLTTDHNEAAELVQLGRLNEDDAWNHPGQHALTSFVGDMDPEIGSVFVPLTGRLLLCTDGLTSGLRDGDIAQLLPGGTAAEAVARLVEAARPHTDDDISVVVVDLDDLDLDSEGADEETTETLAAPTAVDTWLEASLQEAGVEAAGPARNGFAPIRVGSHAGTAWAEGGGVVELELELGEPGPHLEARSWVDRQPASRVGLLSHLRDGNKATPTLIAQHSEDHPLMSPTALCAEANVYSGAWEERRDVNGEELPAGESSPLAVASQPPQSAWLLYGSEASLFNEWDLVEDRAASAAGVRRNSWTVPRHAQPGDLVFIYFMSPIKEVRYVARVASQPWFDVEDAAAAEGRPFGRRQWWAWLTHVQAIEPISLADLERAARSKVANRSHGGTALKPSLVSYLNQRILGGERDANVKIVCQDVVGPAGLPAPRTMTEAEWAGLHAPLLVNESQVETYVVEPLLRHLMAGRPSLSVLPQAHLGKRVVDFLVHEDGAPRLVVEAKQRIKQGRRQPLSATAEAQQVADYMSRANCRGLLVDAFTVHLFEPGTPEPVLSLQRLTATPAQIRELADACWH